MQKRIILALLLAATIPAVIPFIAANAQTQIGDLRQTRSTTINGRVVSIVGNNFILDDGTGQIIVDAGPRWWKEIALAPGEQVTVIGELGRSGEFDAFTITPAYGAVIEIRSPDGPPPWAGGSDRNQPQR